MKRLNFSIAAIICIGLLLSSCGMGIKNKSDLVKYILDEKNGVTSSVTVKEVKINLSPYPLSLIDQDKKTDDMNFKDKSYFVLSLSKDGKELLKQLDFGSYSEMIQVLSFRMLSYVTLTIDGSKPISPINCILQQTYGMSNSNQLLIVFDRKAMNDGRNMKVLVKEFGMGIGDLSFKVDMKNLNYIDNIKL